MAIYTGTGANVTFPVGCGNIGFNLVSLSDSGWDGDDNCAGEAGIATVVPVCFNIQEIPQLIADANCELSVRSSLASINPVVFRVERDHPWFKKLTPESYNWSYVEVKVESVKFLQESLHYPAGIYSEEAAETLTLL